MFSIKDGKQEVTQNSFDLLTVLHPDFKFNVKKTSPLKNSTDLLNHITQYFNAKDLLTFSQLSQTLNHLVKKSEDSNSLSTYAKFQQTFQADQLRSRVDELLRRVTQLEINLSHRRHYTPNKVIFSCDPSLMICGLLIGLVIAAYVAPEAFFIYKIYDNDEYHKETNATICANIKNNYTAAAYAHYSENGCYDRKQPFHLTAILFGVLFPIVAFGCFFTALICSIESDCWNKKYKAKIKGKEVEVSQSEWITILDDLNKLLKSLSVTDKDKEKSKIAIKTLKKKKLPITKLEKTLGNVKEGLTLVSASFFNRQRQTESIKGEIAITIPNNRI